MSLFFSERLHGAIMAYLYKVPFCLLEYHPKCTAFLQEIDYSIQDEATFESYVTNSLTTEINNEKYKVLIKRSLMNFDA
jgi:polysaccharide pyruvyl transferase WcaK-like protein